MRVFKWQKMDQVLVYTDISSEATKTFTYKAYIEKVLHLPATPYEVCIYKEQNEKGLNTLNYFATIEEAKIYVETVVRMEGI
jgi:hypothetical protein